MRAGRKLLLLLTVVFCAYIFLFLHLLTPRRPPNPEDPEGRRTLRTVDSACAAAFKNPSLRKKLTRTLALGDPDRFIQLLEKYLPTCALKRTELSHAQGYGLLDPVLPTFRDPKEVSGAVLNGTTPSPPLAGRNHTGRSGQDMCPRQSPLLQGQVGVQLFDEPQILTQGDQHFNWPPTFEEIAVTYPDLQIGGFYPGPKHCRCRGYNAIIVPYRDRESHLRYFLHYMHQLLQRQQLCYVVIVAEQDDNETFNKGQMMNTAFAYARDLMQFDCYVFHDVDVIAEDDRILYTCRDDRIMHYAPYIDKFNYEFFKGITVGAAVGFTEELFVSVNGYSNEYAGWGGEDDDMMERINMKKHIVWRSEQNYTRFKMIKHGSDAGNSENSHRWDRLHLAVKRQPLDGVNNLDTTISDEIKYRTHTRLKVKTYKTGLQRELDQMEPIHPDPRVTKPEAPKKLNKVPDILGQKGIPIYLPGKVLHIKPKL
ncbi:unnamed protein product [Clavelina lepadiformis]|uniref:Beta-1,4-galactosyltransferase n=1 Tax=Clavelina lepadiformis TaxID=159417 RepID=A0ABP0EY05_CLALP